MPRSAQLLTEPPRSTPTVHYGPSVSLHGDTTANYDGGKSNWKAKSIKRAAGCKTAPTMILASRRRHVHRDVSRGRDHPDA